jgi:hypothetical protein
MSDFIVKFEKSKHFEAGSVHFPSTVTQYQREVIICAAHITHYLYPRGATRTGMQWAADIEEHNVSLQCAEIVRVLRQVEGDHSKTN